MKTKLLAAVALAVLLVLVGQYVLLPDWYRGSGIRPSGWLMMLSIALAAVLSIVVINWEIKKLNPTMQRAKQVGSYLGGYVLYPFALFVGFVVGGNFGGAIGSNALGEIGTVVGIGLGVFIVTMLICSVGVLLGFALGGLAEKLATRS